MDTEYRPAIWEKIVSASVAVAIVALVGFLVIRNEPFADQQLAALVRILLSLATAVNPGLYSSCGGGFSIIRRHLFLFPKACSNAIPNGHSASQEP